ncbi:hypothetical protein M0811_06384 [Anaeramoeba ignava]|uniref:Uncharacterized protein n=1 Tax=Anaeramoeba ignava TaxID=1746090 RepID=A0A9Q0LSC1_ANAIG|nr:hypothetical protein M0811_06384 [Anaeramoeba ignava]
MLQPNLFILPIVLCFIIWTVAFFSLRITTKVRFSPLELIYIGFCYFGVLLFFWILFLNVCRYLKSHRPLIFA